MNARRLSPALILISSAGIISATFLIQLALLMIQKKRRSLRTGSENAQCILELAVNTSENNHSSSHPFSSPLSLLTRKQPAQAVTAFNVIFKLQSSFSAISGSLKERIDLDGWRFTATMAVILATTVLILNMAAATYMFVLLQNNGASSIIGPILTSSCAEVKRIDGIVHLFVNIASTMLLSGSNFCMQSLVAPTRWDIDKAHNLGRWCDVAMPSLRNLRFMRGKRLVLWLCLGLSSLPLHLL